MATEQKITYCRICEPLCGLIATVEDGRLTEKDVPDLINKLLDAPWQRLVGAAHAP